MPNSCHLVTLNLTFWWKYNFLLKEPKLFQLAYFQPQDGVNVFPIRTFHKPQSTKYSVHISRGPWLIIKWCSTKAVTCYYTYQMNHWFIVLLSQVLLIGSQGGHSLDWQPWWTPPSHCATQTTNSQPPA